MRLRDVLLPLLIAGLATACSLQAIQTEAYRETTPTLYARSDASFLVAVTDQRPYVVSGKLPPGYERRTGTNVALFLPVTRADENIPTGRPVASEVSDMVVRALAQNGIKTEAFDGAVPSDRRLAAAALARSGADRILFLTLHDLQFQMTVGCGDGHFQYDLHVAVLDRRGNTLGETRQKGCDGYPPREYWHAYNFMSLKHHRKQWPAHYRFRLERLLNDPAISAAIAAPKSAHAK